MATLKNFEQGDLVFVKVKGYPHWPATIKEIVYNKIKRNIKYNVEFFGDKTTALISEKDLFPYSQNKTIYGTPKTDNLKNKKFNMALKEAESVFTKTISDTVLNSSSLEPEIELELELKEKILNIDKMREEPNLETSLSLAAEVGSALLKQNHKLNQDLLDVTLKNSKLTIDINELKSSVQTDYLQRIKELEDEREVILNKYSVLVEKLNYVEDQLIKEKQIQADLKKIFEEQDRETEETICKLQKELQQYKLTTTGKTKQDVKKEALVNTGTQTENNRISENSPSSLVLTEIANMKKRQDEADESITKMELKLKLLTVPDLRTKTRHDNIGHAISKSQEELETTVIKDNQLCTPEAGQTCSQKPNPISPNCKTHYSVSLQAAKSRGYKTTDRLHYNKEYTQTAKCYLKLRWSKGPPHTAKLLGDKETYEEFFEREIKNYDPAYRRKTSFLEQTALTLGKMKL